VCARMTSGDQLSTPAVVAHGRLVILGDDNRRLHEEIIDAGGYLREGRFVRMNVTETKQAFSSATDTDAPDRVKQALTRLWTGHSEQLLRALEARMRDRTSGLQKALGDRCEKEISDLTAILNELDRSIRDQMRKPLPEQYELWPEHEMSQLKRDMAALESRLKRIPGEIDQETKAIRDRYARPTPRLFPVAVTYLVPRGT